jgi:hypothetical protein
MSKEKLLIFVMMSDVWLLTMLFVTAPICFWAVDTKCYNSELRKRWKENKKFYLQDKQAIKIPISPQIGRDTSIQQPDVCQLKASLIPIFAQQILHAMTGTHTAQLLQFSWIKDGKRHPCNPAMLSFSQGSFDLLLLWLQSVDSPWNYSNLNGLQRFNRSD